MILDCYLVTSFVLFKFFHVSDRTSNAAMDHLVSVNGCQ
jgi:hypothetical protein